VVKARAKQAGVDPALFSAHGLRSGYLTEAANRSIPVPEAMQQSLHKSVAQAASYYNDSERKLGRAARLIIQCEAVASVANARKLIMAEHAANGG
jgi:integrase